MRKHIRWLPIVICISSLAAVVAHAQDSVGDASSSQEAGQELGFEGALKALQKESGAEATLKKLRKADELTGKNSVGTAERAMDAAGITRSEIPAVESSSTPTGTAKKTTASKAVVPGEILKEVGKLKVGQPAANEEAILNLLSNGDLSREELQQKYQEFLRSRETGEKPLSVSEKVKAETAAMRKAKADAKAAKLAAQAQEKERDVDVVTGMSFEDAIRMLEQESGVDATIRKLKKVDEMTGKNSFGSAQQKLADAGESEVMHSAMPIEARSGPMTAAEKSRSQTFDAVRKHLHSISEVEQFESAMDNVDFAALEANGSSTYAYVENRQKSIKSARSITSDLHSRGRSARNKFKTLNPDLYYGDSDGDTYIGDRKRAVFLPLAELSFADEIVNYSHPEETHDDVQNALGKPDFIKHKDKTVTGIYSLGARGSLTVRFTDNALVNVNGPDLYVFEMGKIEPTSLEISKDGEIWVHVGKIDGGVAEVDIGDYVAADDLIYYVRLTDLGEDSNLPGADVDAIAAIGSAMRLNLESQVLFDSGKSDLKPEGVEAMAELAESISVVSKAKVIVEGHTDSVGSPERNSALSLARAKSVSSQLKKILAGKAYTWVDRGYGEEKPLVENDTDANRAINRRVEVLVLPQ